jgi:hypothetical protein
MDGRSCGREGGGVSGFQRLIKGLMLAAMSSCVLAGFLPLMAVALLLVASLLLRSQLLCTSALNAACTCRTPSGKGGGSKAQGEGYLLGEKWSWSGKDERSEGKHKRERGRLRVEFARSNSPIMVDVGLHR